MLDLDDYTIHLWYADQADFAVDELEEHCLAWLTDDEAGRYRRFYFERHRKQFLLGRMLMRTTLSQYSEIAPQHWQFVENSYGKPAIDPRQGRQPLFFNLSHSGDRLAIAVCRHEYIGVDIESTEKARREMSIAKRYFSPREIQELSALPETDHRSGFYELWTLKEAYIKARGLGLAIPLRQFSFSFPTNHRLEVSFASALEDDVSNWQFWQLDPGRPCKLALAVKIAEGKITTLESRQFTLLDRFVPVKTEILRTQESVE